MSTTTPVRTEFAAAIAQIANERGISAESIVDGIRLALVSAYRKQFGPLDETWYYDAVVNAETGESRIMKFPVLATDPETLMPTRWNEKKGEDVTPAGFGRIAAQTAKQVILQKIRESEREHVLADFSGKIGTILAVQILRMDSRTVVVDLGRGMGYMPPEEQVRGEFYRMNDRITVLIRDIRDTGKGRSVIVSRAARELVSLLFAREVPEVGSGVVRIVQIAREAGVRTKLAVDSTQEGVDPVGACVGQRGVRVQEVIREVNNEKIDIIPYTKDIREFMRAALAPADGLQVEIDEQNRKAVVTAPDDQLSLCIGRGGQNVRLAAKLTGYHITVKSQSGTVQSTVTGQEEYEIDTFEGLDAEVRTFLIQHKLTTSADLARFTNRWQLAEEVSDAQKAILQAKVDIFEKEMAERDRIRELKTKQEAAAAAATEATPAEA